MAVPRTEGRATDRITAKTHADPSADSLADSIAEALPDASPDVSERGQSITYCGAGIAASSAAFALPRLGHDDVPVYDASRQKWASKAALHLETG